MGHEKVARLSFAFAFGYCINLCIYAMLRTRATKTYAGPSGSAYQTVTYTQWYIPDDVLMQFILLMMSTGLFETCREVK
jgi:hypothetical protein